MTQVVRAKCVITYNYSSEVLKCTKVQHCICVCPIIVQCSPLLTSVSDPAVEACPFH